MALSVTTRPLTPDEARHLTHWEPPRFGWYPTAAWLLMVPIIVAGIVGFTLIFSGLSLGLVLVISYAVGLAFGIFALSSRRRSFHEAITRHQEARRRAHAGGTMLILQFSIVRAWHVDGLDDFSPGYVFDTGAEECVFLGGPELPLAEDRFPASEITVEAFPEIHEIHALQLGPGVASIEDEPLEFYRLGIDLGDGARLIPRATVLAELQSETSTIESADRPESADRAEKK